LGKTRAVVTIGAVERTVAVVTKFSALNFPADFLRHFFFIFILLEFKLIPDLKLY
jgi:hypothetical protein